MFKLITIGLTKNLKLGFSNFYCRGQKKLYIIFFFLRTRSGGSFEPPGLVLEPPLRTANPLKLMGTAIPLVQIGGVDKVNRWLIGLINLRSELYCFLEEWRYIKKVIYILIACWCIPALHTECFNISNLIMGSALLASRHAQSAWESWWKGFKLRG